MSMWVWVWMWVSVCEGVGEGWSRREQIGEHVGVDVGRCVRGCG